MNDLEKKYIQPDYTESPALIYISRTLVRNGLTGIQLIFLPNFLVFYNGTELLEGKYTIDNIAKLSSRHVIIEKYIPHETDSCEIADNLPNTLASRPVTTHTYKYNSTVQFINFLKENRARKIFLLVDPLWTVEEAEKYINLVAENDPMGIVRTGTVRLAMID